MTTKDYRIHWFILPAYVKLWAIYRYAPKLVTIRYYFPRRHD